MGSPACRGAGGYAGGRHQDEAGTGVDFGELSRKLIHWLGRQDDCAFHPAIG